MKLNLLDFQFTHLNLAFQLKFRYVEIEIVLLYYKIYYNRTKKFIKCYKYNKTE